MTTKPTASSSLSLDVILATATEGDKSGSLVDGFSAEASKFSTWTLSVTGKLFALSKAIDCSFKRFLHPF
jgi:hypothetical protein